jgi:glutamate--cysteine ligase
MYCLFERSPMCDDDERARIGSNLKSVVNRGREPGLKLTSRKGDITLPEWGNSLMDGIDKIAVQLDRAHGGNDYQRVCNQQREKLADPSLTPSAPILAAMTEKPFFSLAMKWSTQHKNEFESRPLTGDDLANFQRYSKQSIDQQAQVEAADTISFDQYLSSYYQQYQDLS